MPSRLANSWSDRARPLTSSSNHARPRAIALISAGSHRELWSCCANPGRTNLVSAPRRVKAAVAVSSTALSLAVSDADDATSGPNRRPRRSSTCDPALIKAIARGRAWFEELVSGRARSLQELAKRDGISRRYIRRLIGLAFLSPELIETILQGRQSVEVTATRLTELDLPLDWT